MIIKKKFADWQMKKIILLVLFFCFLLAPLIITISSEDNRLIVAKVATVNAEDKKTIFTDIKTQLDTVATAAQLKTDQRDLPTIIGNIIKVVLMFLGIIAIIMIIIGGLMWMTSGGSEEKAKKAKEILVNAIIGLFIVLMAYVITYWVVNELSTKVLVTPTK